jgi:SAM-dependent methyltransferase
MADAVGHLRLYSPDRPSAAVLAARELLRPPADRPGRRDLEPFTRGWFEQIELTRYARAGAWLPRVLEFSRHAGESLLMLGPGLGTDAIQYARHGTRVTVCLTPADEADAVRRNYDLRGLEPTLVPVASAAALPFARGAFDLAYLNALHADPGDLPAVADELYRVLKPGGKVFALFPARFDVDRWRRWLHPFPRWAFDPPPRPTAGPRRTGRELAAAFARFGDRTLNKRHLRRAELPPSWRAVPLALWERVAGRVLALRAFKPLAAAREERAAA